MLLSALRYDFQYDIASMLASLVLILVFTSRRGISTRSMRIFSIIVFDNLFTAILDCISIFTISQPEKYNLVFNYAVCMGYLFFYNCLSALFFMYVDSRTKIPRLQIPNRIISGICLAFYAIVILSSPWTHAIAYFDENLNYLHGPLMPVLYGLPFLMFAYEIVMFIIARKMVNRYQIAASLALIITTALSVVITIVIPRCLIAQLVMALVLYFIYMAYENPAHFNFQDTSCFDRQGFLVAVNRRSRLKKDYAAVAFLINDYDYIRHTSGQKFTSKVSVKVADFLSTTFNRNAFALSEEKFVVFTDNPSEVSKTRYTILNFFMQPFNIDGMEVPISITHCTIRDLGEGFDAEAVERLVDYRLLNPDNHANSLELVHEAFQKRDHENQILHVLKKALSEDLFQVYYQPIYNIQTGAFESAEALLRIYDEDMGFINPEELIILAERYHYVSQIGDIVFRKVCQFIHDGELRRHGIHYIEVNLSPVQAREIDVVEHFQNIMETYGISPNLVNLEITETAEIENEKKMMNNIEQMHNLGISFSIDDYGSGFASADYLLRLPVNIVKIDKMILWNAMESADAMIVLKNTINMLKELNKKIVVEGVESQEMVDVLKELGVDYLQGFLYSRPIPQDDFIKFLDAHIEEEDPFTFELNKK